MHRYMILLPLLAQVALTFVVWITMYVTRFREIGQKRLPASRFVTRSESQKLLTESAPASDNLQNLFEMPLLFFVGILTIYVTGLADHVYLALGFVYVAARAVHSIAAIALRNVPIRFAAYVISSIVLGILWIRIAASIISSQSIAGA